MPYTDAAKNAMLDAEHRLITPTFSITHACLFTVGGAQALTTPFGTASTDRFTKTGHGLSVGDLIVITALGGGGTGIVLNHPYFVKTVVDANTFELSGVPAGPILDFTSDVTVSGSYLKLTEVTGGSPAYARKAMAWNAATQGTIDDSTPPVFDVPAGTVSYVGFTSHVSTALSTANILRGIQDVADEVYAAQGTYTLTDVDGLAPD